MQLVLEKSPHIAKRRTTMSMMIEFAITLMVLFIASEIYYYVDADYGPAYGNSGLIAFFCSLGTSVIADGLWNLSCFWDKKVTSAKEKFKNWGMKTLRSYGWISGIIFTLLLPVLPVSKMITPYFIFATVISSFVGTFLAKDIFGGFGKNVFNPAVVSRVFFQLCFQSTLTSSYHSYLKVNKPDFYAIDSGASLMARAQSSGWTTLNNGTNLFQLLFTDPQDGTIGEVLTILVFAVGIYLSIREIIDWRTPVFYVLTFFLTTLVMGFASGFGAHAFEFALCQCLMGGVLLGGTICLTDPVTNPTTRMGRIFSAVFCAFITALVRYQASSAEGVATSILVQNMINPLIEKAIKGKQTDHRTSRSLVITAVMACSLVFGGVYGAFHKTSDDFSGNPEYVTEINEILKNMNLPEVSKNDVSLVDKDHTFPTDANNGSYKYKVSGITVNGKPTYYYDATTTPINAENFETSAEALANDNMYVNYGVLVNEDGIIGAEVLGNGDLQTVTPEEVKSAAATITAENPYTASSEFGTLGSYPSAGATVTAGLTDLLFKSIINDYMSDKMSSYVETINTLLGAQNLGSVKASDLSVAGTSHVFSTESNNGSYAVKVSGITVNGKPTYYYDVTTTPINAENFETSAEALAEDNMYVNYGVLANEDGIIGAEVLGNGDLQTVTPDEVKSAAAAITAENPYTASSEFGTLGSYPSAGATVTAGLTDLLFKSVINDAAGGNK